MFAAWARLAVRFRKTIPLIVIGLIALLYAVFGSQLPAHLSQSGWDDPHSASTAAEKLETQIYGRDSTGDIILLFTAPAGKTIPDFHAELDPAVNAFTSTLMQNHGGEIEQLNSYFEQHANVMLAEDKTAAFVTVGMKVTGGDTLAAWQQLKPEFTQFVAALHDNPATAAITAEIAGTVPISEALDTGMKNDLSRAELYALPTVGVLLVLVFGSLTAAAMPLLVGIVSILGSFGILDLLTRVVTVNVFAQSVVTLLGLGLAIDYGLFMVSRFREELARGQNPHQAAKITTATAGKTVVFSAAMVAVALSGMLLFPQAFLKSLAYGAISAVGLAALLSVSVLPCLFALLGKNIDRLAVRKPKANTAQLNSSIWARIPRLAMKRSVPLTIGLVALLLALTYPLVGIKFGGLNETYLPPNNTTRQAQAHFDQQFPDMRTEPVKLVVQGANNTQLGQIVKQANETPGLTKRFGAVHPTKDGVTVLSAGITDKSQYTQVVNRLRELSVPAGVTVYVGGMPAIEVESIEALFDRLPWMLLYMLVSTFLLMTLVFGSMILPAKAVIMSFLGMGATLGILTAMFVDGVGADLFNFSAGPLMSAALVLILAIVYGLSTDYEVFLVSRMVEAKEQGQTTDDAIATGTAHTGNIITAAAVIMIVVCGAFGFSEIVMMKYIAFGMIAALLLDATLIRMLLVPAVMHLLKEDSWWAPRWVKKAAAFVGHGAAPQATLLEAATASSYGRHARKGDDA